MMRRFRDWLKTLNRGPRDKKREKWERFGEVMNVAERSVVTVFPTTPIKKVAEKMVEYGFRRLPVIEAGSERLVGIVSSMDIIDFCGGGEKHNIIEKDFGGNFLSAINAPVRIIMEEDVICIDVQADLQEVIDKMIATGRGGLPVVDKEGRLMGIVTERDVIVKAHRILSDETVEDYMTRDVIVSSPGMRLRDLIRIFVRNGIRRTPVVQEEELVGIITVTDVLTYLVSEELFERMTSFEEEPALEIWVERVMKSDVITVGPKDSLKDAVELMVKNEIGGLPVVNGRRLLGIITEKDILEAML